MGGALAPPRVDRWTHSRYADSPAAAAVAGLSAYLLWVPLSTRGGANAPPVVGGQEVAS